METVTDVPAEIRKSSGLAFELVFKEAAKDAVKSPQSIQSPPKQSSLEEITKRQQAAEERKKQAVMEKLESLAIKHSEIAKKKATKEENNNRFKEVAKETLNDKFKKSKEIQDANKEVLREKSREYKEKHERARARKEKNAENEETSPTTDMPRAQ